MKDLNKNQRTPDAVYHEYEQLAELIMNRQRLLARQKNRCLDRRIFLLPDGALYFPDEQGGLAPWQIYTVCRKCSPNIYFPSNKLYPSHVEMGRVIQHPTKLESSGAECIGLIPVPFTDADQLELEDNLKLIDEWYENRGGFDLDKKQQLEAALLKHFS